MAKFYRDLQGNYGLRRNADEEARAAVPAGATVVAFDEATNQDILDSLDGKAGFRWQDHTISGGQILRAGVPLTITPDGSTKQERDDFDAAAAAYLADMQAYLAIADTATNIQVRDQVKRLTQGVVRIVRISRQLRQLQKG